MNDLTYAPTNNDSVVLAIKDCSLDRLSALLQLGPSDIASASTFLVDNTVEDYIDLFCANTKKGATQDNTPIVLDFIDKFTKFKFTDSTQDDVWRTNQSPLFHLVQYATRKLFDPTPFLQLLVQHGADVNARRYKDGPTALMILIAHASIPKGNPHLKSAIEWLVTTGGADVNAVDARGSILHHLVMGVNNTRDTLDWLYRATNFDTVDLEITDDNGRTPLALAVDHFVVSAVLVLLQAGANAHVRIRGLDESVDMSNLPPPKRFLLDHVRVPCRPDQQMAQTHILKLLQAVEGCDRVHPDEYYHPFVCDGDY